MHTVTSADGTPIAFWRSGQGPPLLLVHGSTADHTTTWHFVLPLFERHFTVYLMDRRGRGGSGDSADYRLEREAEDIIAVLGAIGQPAHLLGHSYGALCALEAARLVTDVRSLVLYEVPLRTGDERVLEAVNRMDALLAEGDREGALVTMLREVVDMPEREVELLRSQSEAWSARLGNAGTVPRELRAVEEYEFEPERFRDVSTPTVLMVGEESPRRELDHTSMVAAALPDACVVVLPEQQHVAMYTAPELFVDRVVAAVGK